MRAIAVMLVITGVIGSGCTGKAAPPPVQDSSAFRLVVVDSKTEAKLGPFPYDREVYARAVSAVHAAGAKGIVYKYFLDQAKTPAGDKAFADALAKVPALLQASLQPDGTTRDLPVPSGIGNAAQFHPRLKGDKAWLPLEPFAATAAGIGFVDIPDASAPTRISEAPSFELPAGRTGAHDLWYAQLVALYGLLH